MNRNWKIRNKTQNLENKKVRKMEDERRGRSLGHGSDQLGIGTGGNLLPDAWQPYFLGSR